MSQKLVLVSMVLLICVGLFASFDTSNCKVNVGVGFQPSVGFSYDFGKYETGLDIRTFYTSYLLGIAAPLDITTNSPLAWVSIDAYGLREVFSKEKLTIDLGVGVINNPYRRALLDKNKAEYGTAQIRDWANWENKKEDTAGTYCFLFQTRAVTFTADARFAYSFTENDSISLFLELPVLGVVINQTVEPGNTSNPVLSSIFGMGYLARFVYSHKF